MRVYIITAAILFTTITAHPINSRRNTEIRQPPDNNPKNAAQTKRDLSLSYAATHVDSKEGTRVKTITVIKNLGHENEKLKIDPELHKNEDWANAFRDNFDTFGRIPDVPDIDDLFMFVNKNKQNGKEELSKSKPKLDPKPKEPEPSKTPQAQDEKPVVELSEDQQTTAVTDEGPVEKIKGDAELLPNSKNTQSSLRSQSLASGAMRSEKLIDLNYSTPQHSVRQYYENYIQANDNGYDYSKPCLNSPPGSVNVNTPSGRNYNIPVSNSNGNNPYLAPAVSRRAQAQPPSQTQQQPQSAQGNTQNFPNANQPIFPVNSLLPPLQVTPRPVGNNPTIQPQVQTQPQGGFSTSQRPYVAPNLRNGLNTNRGRSQTPPYNTDISSYGPRPYGSGRSRGLKY